MLFGELTVYLQTKLQKNARFKKSTEKIFLQILVTSHKKPVFGKLTA